MRMHAIPAATLAFLAVTAPVAHHPATVVVHVGPGLTYSPETVNIHVGDSVKWVFDGSARHSVHKGANPSQPCKAVGDLDSGPRHNGQTYSYRFTLAESVTYMSTFDDQCYRGMIGHVEVND